MARPKYKVGDTTVDTRLEEAFWRLIDRFPIKEITVNMIVAEAQCTRGSFYYHFSDMDSLIESVIEHNLPTQIPYVLISLVLTDTIDTTALSDDPQFVRKVDRICLLVGPHGSIEAMERIRKAIRGAWLSALELDESTLTHESRVLFEFLINGILGVLAYRARTNTDYNIASYLEALLPIPKAFVKHLMNSTRHRSADGQTPSAPSPT